MVLMSILQSTVAVDEPPSPTFSSYCIVFRKALRADASQWFLD